MLNYQQNFRPHFSQNCHQINIKFSKFPGGGGACPQTLLESSYFTFREAHYGVTSTCVTPHPITFSKNPGSAPDLTVLHFHLIVKRLTVTSIQSTQSSVLKSG